MICKPAVWEISDGQIDSKQATGYQWWYIDGLVECEQYWLVISFHLSNKSMISFSKNLRPCYRLTIARKFKTDHSDSINIIYDEKEYFKTLQISNSELIFTGGVLKLYDKHYELFIEHPQIELQVFSDLKSSTSPRVIFFNKIYMQQIQLSPSGTCKVKLTDNGVMSEKIEASGTAYMETVHGNMPCFVALKNWFWLRLVHNEFSIVLAYANTNLLCRHQPVSIFTVWYQSKKICSITNALNCHHFKSFDCVTSGIKMSLDIVQLYHFQNYSPYVRLNNLAGTILNSLLSGKCTRSLVSVNLFFEQDNLSIKYENIMAICEFRAFYGYQNQFESVR